MHATLERFSQRPTVSDLLHMLGDIPPERVLMVPLPGTATEQDVLDLDDHEDRICELYDGVLVEKTMNSRESRLAVAISSIFVEWVSRRKLGAVLGEAGMLRLRPRLVLIPDVAFISQDKYRRGKFPADEIAPLAPDIAVEILSKSNTPREMSRKRREYFHAGTKLVWEFDARRKTVDVYTSPDQFTTLGEKQTLTGKPVLNALKIPLKKLFAELDQ